MNFGHWEFGFSEGHCTWARVTGETEHIIILADAMRLAEAADLQESNLPLWVLNLSAQEIWCEDETEVFKYDGTSVKPEDQDDYPIIPLAGYGRFFLDDFDGLTEDFDEEFGDDDEFEEEDEFAGDEPKGSLDSPDLSPFSADIS